jgi:hypothetical protein
LSVKQNEIAMTDLQNSIQTELVSLNANLKEAYDQWHIHKQNVEAAEINYIMMNDRYRYGLGKPFRINGCRTGIDKSKIRLFTGNLFY